MTGFHRMRAGLIVLSAFAISGASNASEADANIAGTWAFEAEVQEDCQFAGTAKLTRTAKPNYYSCEMTVRDVCQGNEAIVRQSCVVTRDGNDVKVNAVIEEFFLEPNGNYMPDNFRLTYDPDTGEMAGELDSYGIWKARWKRSGGATS